MEGLFYNHDNDGITFLRLYPDGKVISFGKSTRFDQVLPSFPYFRIDTDKTHFASGAYQIEDGGGIKIRVDGNFGITDYRGTIRNNDVLWLNCRCPFTNHRKCEKFRRFSEAEHIIHFEVSKRIDN